MLQFKHYVTTQCMNNKGTYYRIFASDTDLPLCNRASMTVLFHSMRVHLPLAATLSGWKVLDRKLFLKVYFYRVQSGFWLNLERFYRQKSRIIIRSGSVFNVRLKSLSTRLSQHDTAWYTQNPKNELMSLCCGKCSHRRSNGQKDYLLREKIRLLQIMIQLSDTFIFFPACMRNLFSLW